MQALNFLLFKCYDKYTPKAFMLKGCTCLIIFIQPEKRVIIFCGNRRHTTDSAEVNLN